MAAVQSSEKTKAALDTEYAEFTKNAKTLEQIGAVFFQTSQEHREKLSSIDSGIAAVLKTKVDDDHKFQSLSKDGQAGSGVALAANTEIEQLERQRSPYEK